jgi:histidyl-tRNA synthetase
LWEQQTFIDKAGEEILGQMYAFKDKGDRDICLLPEATAVIQKMFNEEWNYILKKPVKLFYVQRCYRYEKPQAGRYREFTQFGIERLGGDKEAGREEVIRLLKGCLDLFPIDYKFNDTVKRGLNYYVEDGFEVEVETLGAQKQIAGGGRYKEGIGWAIGLDRMLMSYK